LPKGQVTNPAILNNCTPTGIPIMEIQHNNPARHNDKAQNKPPNNNQIILPKVFTR